MKLLTLTLLMGCASLLSAADFSDVVYRTAGGETLKLDVHVPDAGPGPFPAAILVHGGGWTAGHKQQFITYLFEPLTKANYVWFSIDYRLAPRHRWPAQAEDVEAAIAWVFENAAKYKVDARRVALVGESAGGHLASYAALRTSHKLAAAVILYGVHDFIARAFLYARIDPSLNALFGVSTLNSDTSVVLREASPATYVRAGLPPMLLMHGIADAAVPYAQSVDFCSKLRSKGNACELYTVNGPHGMDRWEMDPQTAGYKTKFIAWLNQTLGRP